MKTYSRKKPGEQEEVIIDLNELCRLCMAKEDALVPIFNEADQIPLPLRIMACVSLEVLEGDGLPNKICHPCNYQLEKSYMFRKKCESSDLKLRHHIRELGERLGEIISEEEEKPVIPLDEKAVENAEPENPELTTEQDIVGVTQVAYLQPEPEPEEDPESITLSSETEHINKEACTLETLSMKKEIIEDEAEEEEEEAEEEDLTDVYLMNDHNEAMQEDTKDEQHSTRSPDLDLIAETVKSTLASHTNLNLSGNLEMKVDQQPGKPTQVEVTTEDGSVIVMELTSEDLEQHASAMSNVDIDDEEDFNEEGELKVFRCPSCPKSFARRIQLRRHESVHMQQRGFSCGICEKWFPTRSALIRHERIHTGERPFQCEVCPKSFAQKEILFRHFMTHTGLKPYNCPHCSKGFTQKEPLRVHLKTHLNATDSEAQFHRCTLCPKVFCHASGLSRHLVTHTGKTFKCRDCEKSFTDKSSLRRHLRQSNHQE